MLDQDSRQVAALRQRIEDEESDTYSIGALTDGVKSPQTKATAARAAANFPFECVLFFEFASMLLN